MSLKNFSKPEMMKSDVSSSKFDPGKRVEPVGNAVKEKQFNKNSETSSKIEPVKSDVSGNGFNPDKKVESDKNLDSNRERLDTYDPGKRLEVNNESLERREEWIRQTPREDKGRGQWTGERGESKFVPSDAGIKEALKEYKIDGIEYKGGVPDFSKIAKATVSIDNMTSDRQSNFAQCDMKCAEKWNQEGHDGRTDWTARDVKNYRKSNGCSWHERVDMKTCDLVDTKIHLCFKHSGGVAECKYREGENNV